MASASRDARAKVILTSAQFWCAQVGGDHKEELLLEQAVLPSGQTTGKKESPGGGGPLVIIYHVLQSDQTYTELGGDYSDRHQVEQQRDYYLRPLQMLGLKITVEIVNGGRNNPLVNPSD